MVCLVPVASGIIATATIRVSRWPPNLFSKQETWLGCIWHMVDFPHHDRKSTESIILFRWHQLPWRKLCPKCTQYREIAISWALSWWFLECSHREIFSQIPQECFSGCSPRYLRSVPGVALWDHVGRFQQLFSETLQEDYSGGSPRHFGNVSVDRVALLPLTWWGEQHI